MQCYRYLASAQSVANALEAIPDAPKKLPLNVVADWMEENGLDSEELFRVRTDETRAAGERLVHSTRPEIPHAASLRVNRHFRPAGSDPTLRRFALNKGKVRFPIPIDPTIRSASPPILDLQTGYTPS